MSKEYVYEMRPTVKQYIYIVANSKEEADAKLRNRQFDSIVNSGISSLSTKEIVESSKLVKESEIKKSYVFSIEKSLSVHLSIKASSAEEAEEYFRKTDNEDLDDLEDIWYEDSEPRYNKDTLKFLYAE